MNRLAPLITRSSTRLFAYDDWPVAPPPAASSTFLEDCKLFAIGWLGGLIFFGTLIA